MILEDMTIDGEATTSAARTVKFRSFEGAQFSLLRSIPKRLVGATNSDFNILDLCAQAFGHSNDIPLVLLCDNFIDLYDSSMEDIRVDCGAPEKMSEKGELQPPNAFQEQNVEALALKFNDNKLSYEIHSWNNRIKYLEDKLRVKVQELSCRKLICDNYKKQLQQKKALCETENNKIEKLRTAIEEYLNNDDDISNVKRAKHGLNYSTLQERILPYDSYPPDFQYIKLLQEYEKVQLTLRSLQNKS